MAGTGLCADPASSEMQQKSRRTSAALCASTSASRAQTASRRAAYRCALRTPASLRLIVSPSLCLSSRRLVSLPVCEPRGQKATDFPKDNISHSGEYSPRHFAALPLLLKFAKENGCGYTRVRDTRRATLPPLSSYVFGSHAHHRHEPVAATISSTRLQ
jgi:hypothetical protein